MKGRIEETRQARLDGPDAPGKTDVDRAAEAFRIFGDELVAATNDNAEPLNWPQVSTKPPRLPAGPLNDDYWIETYAGIVRAIMEREQERQGVRGPAA